ncbi:MAG: hypothetical protein HWD59_09730 [Coxiellaceae bacterium]|nr:MAG: hypothetical protein HWD59_09730 [Coxiellaceae bacterium]
MLASVISVKNPSADTNNNNVGSAPVSTGGSPSRKTDFSKFAVNNVSNVIFLNENSLCYVMNSEPLWNIDVVSSDVNMLLKRFPISEQRSSFYKDEVYFARKDIEKTIEKKLESGTTHAYIAYQIELKPKAYEKVLTKTVTFCSTSSVKMLN